MFIDLFQNLLIYVNASLSGFMMRNVFLRFVVNSISVHFTPAFALFSHAQFSCLVHLGSDLLNGKFKAHFHKSADGGGDSACDLLTTCTLKNTDRSFPEWPRAAQITTCFFWASNNATNAKRAQTLVNHVVWFILILSSHKRETPTNAYSIRSGTKITVSMPFQR